MKQQILAREADLEKVASRLIRSAAAILNQSESDLARQVRERFGWIAARGYDSSSLTLKRVEAGLLDIDSILRQAYKGVEADLRGNLLTVGKQEIALQKELLAGITDRDLKSPQPGAVGALLANVPFRGGRLRDWIIRLTDNAMQRVEGAIRGRLAARLPIDDVVRAVIGSKAKGWMDGVTEPGRNELAKVAKSALQFTTGKAREEVWKVNDGIVEALEWVAVVDGAKCPLEPSCSDRGGLLYNAVTHEPIDHDIPWLEGPGLVHWNCRCVAIPVIVANREEEAA
jgi:hypothetical protein